MSDKYVAQRWWPQGEMDETAGMSWVVLSGTIPRFGRRMTEAEAHIIAWALNNIAEGRAIVALVPPDFAPDGPRYAGFYCEDYTGPTDGVAP